MNRRTTVLASLVFAWAAFVMAGGPRLTHLPPERATRGDAVEISVELDDVAIDGSVWLTLHYQPQGVRGYSSVRMTHQGGTRFAAEIPSTGTNSLGVNYYIDAESDASDFGFGLGSQHRPMKLSLREPLVVSDTAQLGWKIVLAAVPMLLLGGAMTYFDRHKRRILLDKLFWMQSLSHLLGLRGSLLSREITALADDTFQHPIYGARRYKRTTLMNMVIAIRKWDRKQLVADAEHHLGAREVSNLRRKHTREPIFASVLDSAPAEAMDPADMTDQDQTLVFARAASR